VLRAICVTAVFENIISKLPDGVEVFAAVVCIWGFCGEADGELKD
jgi:hypothetical protein